MTAAAKELPPAAKPLSRESSGQGAGTGVPQEQGTGRGSPPSAPAIALPPRRRPGREGNRAGTPGSSGTSPAAGTTPSPSHRANASPPRCEHAENPVWATLLSAVPPEHPSPQTPTQGYAQDVAAHPGGRAPCRWPCRPLLPGTQQRGRGCCRQLRAVPSSSRPAAALRSCLPPSASPGPAQTRQRAVCHLGRENANVSRSPAPPRQGGPCGTAWPSPAPGTSLHAAFPSGAEATQAPAPGRSPPPGPLQRHQTLISSGYGQHRQQEQETTQGSESCSLNFPLWLTNQL